MVLFNYYIVISKKKGPYFYQGRYETQFQKGATSRKSLIIQVIIQHTLIQLKKDKIYALKI